MKIDARTYVHFEVCYRDQAGKEVTEAVIDSPDYIRRFVADKLEEGCSVQSVNFFVDIIVEAPDQNPRGPNNRFGERCLKADELSIISDEWIRFAAESANSEIDEYMKMVYKADYSTGS